MHRRGFDPPLRIFFPVERIFPLELTWVQTPFPQNSSGWEYKPRSSLCTHAFHRTDSKDPDIHVLDGWMPARKTHTPGTIHEDGMWLPQCLDLKKENKKRSHTWKSCPNGEPHRYSWGTQQKMNNKLNTFFGGGRGRGGGGGWLCDIYVSFHCTSLSDVGSGPSPVNGFSQEKKAEYKCGFSSVRFNSWAIHS